MISFLHALILSILLFFFQFATTAVLPGGRGLPPIPTSTFSMRPAAGRLTAVVPQALDGAVIEEVTDNTLRIIKPVVPSSTTGSSSQVLAPSQQTLIDIHRVAINQYINDKHPGKTIVNLTIIELENLLKELIFVQHYNWLLENVVNPFVLLDKPQNLSRYFMSEPWLKVRQKLVFADRKRSLSEGEQAIAEALTQRLVGAKRQARIAQEIVPIQQKAAEQEVIDSVANLVEKIPELQVAIANSNVAQSAFEAIRTEGLAKEEALLKFYKAGLKLMEVRKNTRLEVVQSHINEFFKKRQEAMDGFAQAVETSNSHEEAAIREEIEDLDKKINFWTKVRSYWEGSADERIQRAKGRIADQKEVIKDYEWLKGQSLPEDAP